MAKFSIILAAAGKSQRFKDKHYKKPFAILNQKAVWLHSAETFLKRQDVKQVVIVVSEQDRQPFLDKFGPNLAVMGIEVALGGAERSDSVQNALQKVSPDCDFVAVHDAARPCLSGDLIEAVFEAAVTHGAAIPAIRVSSTIKRSADGKQVETTVDRSNLFLAQTPQVFNRKMLESAFAQRGELQPTDEAQLLEELGIPVTIVPGSPLNIKITTRDDLRLADACLKSLPRPKFDAPIHPFADDNLFR